MATAISRRMANVLGVLTILSWGSLGLLGKEASNLPPLFVLAVCFAGATAIGFGLIKCLRKRSGRKPEISGWEVAIGGAGLFTYHFLYFLAFHHAPALEVTLLNYLWPAFVVVIGNRFFALEAGGRGLVTAGIGFLGVVVLFGADPAKLMDKGNLFGFGLAISGAIIWATYTNLRRLGRGDVLHTVTGICAVAALLAFMFSAAVEEIPVLSATHVWTLIVLTIGPAGGVFFLWDIALKHGNAAALAILGYAAPVVSTALLILTRHAEPSFRVILATVLIALAGVATTRSAKSREGPPGETGGD